MTAFGGNTDELKFKRGCEETLCRAYSVSSTSAQATLANLMQRSYE